MCGKKPWGQIFVSRPCPPGTWILYHNQSRVFVRPSSIRQHLRPPPHSVCECVVIQQSNFHAVLRPTIYIMPRAVVSPSLATAGRIAEVLGTPKFTFAAKRVVCACVACAHVFIYCPFVQAYNGTQKSLASDSLCAWEIARRQHGGACGVLVVGGKCATLAV